MAGYLLGSLSGGLLLGALRKIDLRETGSGGTGATNALRSAGPWLALGVLAIDAGKGWLAAWLGSQIAGVWGAVFAALAAIVGHLYPMFFGFRGGKGVATTGGAALYFMPLGVLVSLIVWLLVMFGLWRSSVASMAATAALMFAALVLDSTSPVELFTWIAGAMVFWAHRENLRRLADGSEPRLTIRGR